MRFRLSRIELSAAIRETTDQDGRRRWTFDLIHSPFRGGPETGLCQCNEAELKELANLLDDPSRRDGRFVAFGDMRERLFDREEPHWSRFTITDLKTPGPNEIDREELKSFVWMVGSFVEARKAGMDLDLWSERVDHELSRRKGELEMRFAQEIAAEPHHRRRRR